MTAKRKIEVEEEFDYLRPDYGIIFRRRLEALKRIRAKPECIPQLKEFYKLNPIQFVQDWGVTFDPRNVEVGLPSTIPFVMFPKQVEFCEWVLDRWRAREPGLAEKSRDWGLSWAAVSLSCSLCLHNDGMVVGFGSRKEEYVDKVGQPKSLFWKARTFMEHVPVEFRGGWVLWRDSPHMRINFPETGSVMTGEAGKDIGRGDRTGLHFVDEAAHLDQPTLVEHSLSQTTNCRIDISSVNGMGNPFEIKRHSGKVKVFICDWRDDPRKDQAWYDKQVAELDPITVAQEIDRDYNASAEGVVIPGPWVLAAVDALEKFGIAKTGARFMSLDVADEGVDQNAVIGGEGVEIDYFKEWSGKGSDTFATAERAFNLCDELGYDTIRYDADGIGAAIRGDARIINERRKKAGTRQITVEAFQGSDAVLDPDKPVFAGDADRVGARTNKDYFQNRKAQAWWELRARFYRTFRWRQAIDEAARTGQPLDRSKICDPGDIVSISSKCANHLKLMAEISQPTYGQSGDGKMIINKKPKGTKSPNGGDGVMMRMARATKVPMRISQDALKRSMVARNRR